MNTYVTEIHAICPIRDELVVWCGPNVPGITAKDAQRYCNENGLGYCKVIGQLVSEIPCKPGTHEADFSKQINYDFRNN